MNLKHVKNIYTLQSKAPNFIVLSSTQGFDSSGIKRRQCLESIYSFNSSFLCVGGGTRNMGILRHLFQEIQILLLYFKNFL